FFFFSSRRRHTRCLSDWSSDVCSSDLLAERRKREKRWPEPDSLVVAAQLFSRRDQHSARAEMTLDRCVELIALQFRLPGHFSPRSEEHTSELQSLRHLVCRLLLEKKKK